MGTRSTIKFYQGYSKDTTFLGAIYQQYDGYPEEVGKVLALFLNEISLINGIQNKEKMGIQANGMGCLVAQFIHLNKKSVGGFYMVDERNSQDWNYIVTNLPNEDNFHIIVDNYEKIVFEGNKEQFLEFCNK